MHLPPEAPEMATQAFPSEDLWAPRHCTVPLLATPRKSSEVDYHWFPTTREAGGLLKEAALRGAVTDCQLGGKPRATLNKAPQ